MKIETTHAVSIVSNISQRFYLFEYLFFPEFKGEWKPKQIDNPAYKGVWKHPEVSVNIK